MIKSFGKSGGGQGLAGKRKKGAFEHGGRQLFRGAGIKPVGRRERV